ncbi:basic proline-rich protein-like [Corvus moneduloides]|uniref:basic proline-rich protein-like n=1 Tax=Corvus moneduloides TaxID=1196302 RepID=UPI001363EF07|nr:basic proline-rich protein-like [Corvus moneduloides]
MVTAGRGLSGESPRRGGAASDHPRPPPRRPPRRAPGWPCVAATGPPAGRWNPRERQKFGVPPRPSPPRSLAGAEDDAVGSKPTGVTPQPQGLPQWPAGPGRTAALRAPGTRARGGGARGSPRRVTAPPGRRGASACLRSPPLPRTPRLPLPPPALLQQPPPLLGAAQPCPGLAPPARGDPAGRCRGSARGWGYAPVGVGELCFPLGSSRWFCPCPAQLLGAGPGAEGATRPGARGDGGRSPGLGGVAVPRR